MTVGIVLLMSSCIKEEIPVAAHVAGDVTVNEIDLEPDYRYQAYYDFGTNSLVFQHLKTEWDLGFETGVSGARVVLNTSRAMGAAHISGVDFNSITDTAGVQWRYDATSGNLDSTAIGNWQTLGGVFLINRGYSYDGTHLGFRKLEIASVNGAEYEIHYANLDGSNEQTKVVVKEEAFNFTFWSFETDATASIQPKKENWDLVFGQYAHLFEPDFPYLVTGILSNRNGVEVAEVFNKPFADIEYADVANYSFSSDINVIGYDWKTFGGGSFTVHLDKNYIVKSTEGVYYKMHFIDFYNAQGEKGTPKFEIAAL